MGKQAEEVTICPTNQERVHRNIIRAYDTNDARTISGFVSIPEQSGTGEKSIEPCINLQGAMLSP